MTDCPGKREFNIVMIGSSMTIVVSAQHINTAPWWRLVSPHRGPAGRSVAHTGNKETQRCLTLPCPDPRPTPPWTHPRGSAARNQSGNIATNSYHGLFGTKSYPNRLINFWACDSIAIAMRKLKACKRKVMYCHLLCVHKDSRASAIQQNRWGPTKLIDWQEQGQIELCFALWY